MRHFIRTAASWLLVLLLVFGAAGCGLDVFRREEAPDFSGEAAEPADGSPVKHYFQKLDDTEKHAYNAILSEARAFPQRIAVPTMTTEQLNDVHSALLYDNPELFFLGRSSSVRQSKDWAYFYPQYIMGQSDYEAMLQKCADVAEKILAQAEQLSTPFDKELMVHDKLIAMCSYTDNAAYTYRNTIYGVLCGGSAACEGYAKTMKYLLDQLDIPCYVVFGQSTPPGSATESHMWDIVNLNGKYYHVDLTWDDPVMENGKTLISRTYFNVTDSVISRTHSGFADTDPCTAIDDNYFVHEHLLFADWGEAEQLRTVELAQASIEAGRDGFQLRFGNEAAFNKAKDDLFVQNGVYAILQKVSERTEMPYATDRVAYVFGSENYTIDVIMEK